MKTLLKQFALTVAVLGGVSVANAAPITGTVDFNAVGEIMVDGSGVAAGYNSFDNGDCPTAPSILDPAPCATDWVPPAPGTGGSVLDMLMAGGGPVFIFMPEDFSLIDPSLLAPTLTTPSTAGFRHVGVDVPVIEWILGPVADPFGVNGVLVFEILSGSDTDGGGPLLDLAGTGMFRFIRDCDPFNGGAGCDGFAESIYEDTLGGWTLSDAGGLSISGQNVPAPAVLGLFGLGLVALGMFRRRNRLV